MDKNPHRCTWLDHAAHDRMVDESFIASDKYEDFMHFLHDDDGQPEEQAEKS